MDDKDPKKIPKRLQAWITGAKDKGKSFFGQRKAIWLNPRFKDLFSKSPRRIEFDLKKIELSNLHEKQNWFRWGITVLAVFLVAEMVALWLGSWIRPEPIALPAKKMKQEVPSFLDADINPVLRRNMFNVEGKIPEPFDQGLLDCFEQARPSSSRMQLLGTLVTSDDRFSVALLQEEGSPNKTAVRKDDVFFDNKFVALKVERKKLCFQSKASGELEYIEIPEDPSGLFKVGLAGSDGIVPLSENEYEVKKSFLDEKLLNLNEILQTARAENYVDPATGKFMGFLVQTVDAGSPFSQLGVKPGDILTFVNDIQLDNPGKGLEAFQKLKNSREITIGIIRSGQKTSIHYAVK